MVMALPHPNPTTSHPRNSATSKTPQPPTPAFSSFAFQSIGKPPALALRLHTPGPEMDLDPSRTPSPEPAEMMWTEQAPTNPYDTLAPSLLWRISGHETETDRVDVDIINAPLPATPPYTLGPESATQFLMSFAHPQTMAALVNTDTMSVDATVTSPHLHTRAPLEGTPALSENLELVYPESGSDANASFTPPKTPDCEATPALTSDLLRGFSFSFNRMVKPPVQHSTRNDVTLDTWGQPALANPLISIFKEVEMIQAEWDEVRGSKRDEEEIKSFQRSWEGQQKGLIDNRTPDVVGQTSTLDDRHTELNEEIEYVDEQGTSAPQPLPISPGVTQNNSSVQEGFAFSRITTSSPHLGSLDCSPSSPTAHRRIADQQTPQAPNQQGTSANKTFPVNTISHPKRDVSAERLKTEKVKATRLSIASIAPQSLAFPSQTSPLLNNTTEVGTKILSVETDEKPYPPSTAVGNLAAPSVKAAQSPALEPKAPPGGVKRKRQESVLVKLEPKDDSLASPAVSSPTTLANGAFVPAALSQSHKKRKAIVAVKLKQEDVDDELLANLTSAAPATGADHLGATLPPSFPGLRTLAPVSHSNLLMLSGVQDPASVLTTITTRAPPVASQPAPLATSTPLPSLPSPAVRLTANNSHHGQDPIPFSNADTRTDIFSHSEANSHHSRPLSVTVDRPRCPVVPTPRGQEFDPQAGHGQPPNPDSTRIAAHQVPRTYRNHPVSPSSNPETRWTCEFPSPPDTQRRSLSPHRFERPRRFNGTTQDHARSPPYSHRPPWEAKRQADCYVPRSEHPYNDERRERYTSSGSASTSVDSPVIRVRTISREEDLASAPSRHHTPPARSPDVKRMNWERPLEASTAQHQAPPARSVDPNRTSWERPPQIEMAPAQFKPQGAGQEKRRYVPDPSRDIPGPPRTSPSAQRAGRRERVELLAERVQDNMQPPSGITTNGYVARDVPSLLARLDNANNPQSSQAPNALSITKATSPDSYSMAGRQSDTWENPPAFSYQRAQRACNASPRGRKKFLGRGGIDQGSPPRAVDEMPETRTDLIHRIDLRTTHADDNAPHCPERTEAYRGRGRGQLRGHHPYPYPNRTLNNTRGRGTLVSRSSGEELRRPTTSLRDRIS